MANFSPLTNAFAKFIRSLIKNASTTPATRTNHPPMPVAEQKSKQLISKQSIHR